jgi:2,5-diketo-D-gluconate reductase B
MEKIIRGALRMDRLGLGTFRLSGEACERAVEQALALGYRHIDTAEMYGNEDAIGRALAAAALPRGEIHVTTKVWWENLTPAGVRRALDQSLARLRLDYVDLYLIHWPSPEMNLGAVLETMMALRAEGRIREIGVSNFPLALLRQAVEEIGAPIVCNQIEYHVLLDQSALLSYARAHGLFVTAYCPLAQGRLAEHPALAAIARKHGATPAQVALKWLLDQEAVAAIPKAGRRESQAANLAAWRISLDDEDRAALRALPKNQRFVSPPFAPAWDPPAVS